MILADSDYPTIYKGIKSELDKVAFAVKKEEGKAKKIFYNSATFPCCHNTTYTVPSSQNKYLIWYYCHNPKEAQFCTYYYGFSLLLTDSDGKQFAVLCRPYKNKERKREESIQVFSGHFFSRYRERMKLGNKMSTYDLMTFFFGRNVPYMGKLDWKELTVKPEHYKDSPSAWRIDDGVTFAAEYQLTLDNGKSLHVTKHNTFLSESVLKNEQKPHVPSNFIMRESIMREFDLSDTYL